MKKRQAEERGKLLDSIKLQQIIMQKQMVIAMCLMQIQSYLQ